MHVYATAVQSQYISFDRQYIEDLRNGDIATTQHFFEYFKGAIKRSVNSRYRRLDIIEDIQQETFMRVLHALEQPGAIQQPERFGAYVLSTSHHVVHEALRRRRDGVAEPDGNAPDTRPDPEVLAQYRQLSARVREALDSLSFIDRYLLLALADGKSHDDIARELHMKPSSFRVVLHRARKRLRDKLASDKRTAQT